MANFTGIDEIDGLLANVPETASTRGNRIRKLFHAADRYLFDFNLDTAQWAQFDTASDAWYHGVWVDKTKRRILQYLEGDVYFTECDSDEGFDTEIEALCRFYEPVPAAIGIDSSGETRFYQDRAQLFLDPARAAACLADLPAAGDPEMA